MKVFACTSALLLATAVAQQVGTYTAETHPSMSSQTCTAAGSCTTEQTKIVLDANWRWLHKTDSSTNCYTGNKWNETICPDSKTCVQNCALDGGDYSGTYGIQASGSSVSIKLLTKGQYSTNIGSRIYMMESDTKYKMYKLLNKEFAFDVDVSNLPCGLNGALYFSQMDADGGMSRFPANKAGAKYGTGYCDAQCARDIKFINGDANVKDWKPSETDVNAGTGDFGSCCAEMDIWEANSIANAFTTHPCKSTTQQRCTGDSECGTGTGNRYTGLCDMDGCDLNPFRLGDKTFFGPGSKFKVDTTKPVTVVTQFITDDGTDNGTLEEIRRVYKQGSKVIENASIATKGVDKVNYLSDKVCGEMKVAFGDQDDHAKKGGFKKMSDSMKNGMVLVMSLWDDHAAHCLWLDSKYPTDKDASVPGVLRGTCETTTGDPKDVEAKYPDATVKFSNIKFGAIGSTTGGVSSAPSSGSGSAPSSAPASGSGSTPSSDTPAPEATTTQPAQDGAAKWGQCGGNGWNGPTTCKEGTCKKLNDWYSQCV
jgi:cellulose 1,4-beta-cellobiosidase